jgi:ABC-type cobalamin/Fe3+-siderophores transport system ATPase subunit
VQNATGIIDPNGEIGLKLRTALFPNMTERQVSGIYNKVTENQVGEILTAVPEDFIAFEYRDKRTYIPFEQASPGQQAAALLNLLLKQEAGTLIIDQPEDDLDNRVIMEIVTLLQTTKRKRQIIFATHNPNFVVNGDADKVVVLRPATPTVGTSGATNSPSRIEIEVDGAIETESVRQSITETMEGGHAAFDLRSRKYLFKN